METVLDQIRNNNLSKIYTINGIPVKVSANDFHNTLYGEHFVKSDFSEFSSIAVKLIRKDDSILVYETEITQCKDCYGNGMVECTECNEGTTDCIYCNGTGYTEDIDILCNKCKGKGWQDCDICDGMYEEDCEHCKGTGLIDSDEIELIDIINFNQLILL